jgi:hypothetical protein
MDDMIKFTLLILAVCGAYHSAKTAIRLAGELLG